jgi:hypothetical protein
MKRIFTALSMLIAAIAATSASAAPIVIDDFVDAKNMVQHAQQGYAIPFINQANPYVMEHNQMFGNILGGERDTEIRVFTPLGFFFDAVGVIGDTDQAGPGVEGEFDFGSVASARVRAILEYDGVDPGEETTNVLNNALGLGNINLTADGNGAFALEFRGVDPAAGMNSIGLQIEVTGPGGTAFYSGSVIGSQGASTFTVPYTAFSIQSPFSAATSIRFIFNGGADPDPAVDFNLKSISAVAEGVPEPSTLALAAVGGISMVVAARRRRKAV